MITKTELIKMIVGLQRVGDIDLLEIDSKILNRDVCNQDDITSIRRMANIVNQIMIAYDYTMTPEYKASIEGRTEQYRRMRLRLLTPARINEGKKRLGLALTEVLENDNIYAFLPTGQHEMIKELRMLLAVVENPN